MTAREALFSLLESLRDPRKVLVEGGPAPDAAVDGDAAMLWHARRSLALLMVENRRLTEEVASRVAELERLVRGNGAL